MTGTAHHVMLEDRVARERLIQHGFIEAVHSAPLTRRQVAMLLGQWWHPLHHFPTFLAECIAVLPDIASKCAVAKILFQETGSGDPKAAHEIIFADTMERIGFPRASITGMAAYPATVSLVEGYRASSRDRFAAVGAVFATEVVDLVMVSAIGTAVRRVTGAERLEWVDVHVAQEPDHVEQAGLSLPDDLSPEQREAVTTAADRIWILWGAFFDSLQRTCASGSALPRVPD